LALTSDEPAETIVRAADGTCGKERAALRASALAGGWEPSEVDAVVDRITQGCWRAALADVISARAGAKRAEPMQRPIHEKQPKETPL
jgi:hypothetical protein